MPGTLLVQIKRGRRTRAVAMVREATVGKRQGERWRERARKRQGKKGGWKGKQRRRSCWLSARSGSGGLGHEERGWLYGWWEGSMARSGWRWLTPVESGGNPKEEGGWSGGSNGSGKTPRLEETVGGDGGGEDLRDWTTRSRLGCLYSK